MAKRWKVAEGIHYGILGNIHGVFYVDDLESEHNEHREGYSLKTAKAICSLLGQGFTMETAIRETAPKDKRKSSN